MKIYLILEYKSDAKGNHWAETQAFTSPRERDSVFHIMAAVKPEADLETQDVEVMKRAYTKPSTRQVVENAIDKSKNHDATWNELIRSEGI